MLGKQTQKNPAIAGFLYHWLRDQDSNLGPND